MILLIFSIQWFQWEMNAMGSCTDHFLTLFGKNLENIYIGSFMLKSTSLLMSSKVYNITHNSFAYVFEHVISHCSTLTSYRYVSLNIMNSLLRNMANICSFFHRLLWSCYFNTESKNENENNMLWIFGYINKHICL